MQTETLRDEKLTNKLKYFAEFVKDIPRKWHNKQFDQLKGEHYKTIIQKLNHWDFKMPELVAIISPINGIGKTHLAVCMLKKYIWEWIDKNDYEKFLPHAIFTKERTILAEIQDSYRDKSERGEKQILDYYISVGFLVIDDVFADRQNDFARRTMLHIIDERAEWYGNPTLITSNLNLEEIKGIDTRIMSRINNSMLIEIESENFKDYRKTI